MKKVLLAIALMVFTLSMTLPFATAKAAEALSDPSAEIDELFVEVGAGLYTVDENFKIVKGNNTEYLAKFDDQGELIKSGFKILDVGDVVGDKTIYIYNQNATSFFDIMTSAGEIGNISGFGYYDYAQFKSATSINGNSNFLKLKYTKFDNSHIGAVVKSVTYCYEYAAPDVYAIAYTYYELPEIPEIEDPTVEEESNKTVGDVIADWMAKNLGMTVSSTGALIIVGGLLFYFLRGK